MNNVACVCTVGAYYHNVKDWKIDLPNYDSYLVTDVSEKMIEGERVFAYTKKDIRENLNFFEEVSKKHYWNAQGNRNIIWFYAHFRMLNFYINYPDYDFYWFFDDDVRIDDWEYLISQVDKDNSDFISYFIFKEPGALSQKDVPYIDSKTFSGPGWFTRFPGDGDKLAPLSNEIFGSFFPITRYSNEAMKILLTIHDSGYHGYGEGFVPTSLNTHRLNMRSLIKPDNTSDLFDVNKANILHKNTKINWEWI